MPSVSRKAALPSLKIALAREEDARLNLGITDHVLRARCVEACERMEGDADKTIG